MMQLFSFEGRISRGEYAAISIAAFIIMAIVRVVLAGIIFGTREQGPEATASGAMVAGWVINAVILWPYFAAATKRLHDADQSGWWSLLLLVPLAGVLVRICLVAMPGTHGGNKYDARAVQRPRIASVFD